MNGKTIYKVAHDLSRGLFLLFSLFVLVHTIKASGYPVQFPNAEPEEVGMSSERLQAIVDTIQYWIDTEEIVGGVVLVIRKGKVVLYEARGYADTKRNVPMRVDHIFRLRSMTKPFVGTAILMLAEEEKLCIEDKVAQHIPSFNTPDKEDITIYQLLTHTSGIRGSIFTADGSPFESLWEAVENIGNEGTVAFEPGTSYRYSDPGSSTLGAIIESVTGKPVEDFIHKQIIEPLGLYDTFCTLVAEDDTRRSRIASTYRGGPSEWEQYWDNSQPKAVPFFRASGGMFSTVMDYARFLRVMMDKGRYGEVELLSPVAIRLATSPKTIDVYGTDEWHKVERYYGFQWFWYTENWAGGPVTPGTFGHGGSDGTLGFVHPEEELIALYFTQSRNTTTRRNFMRMVFESIIE